ncbi:MAG TPA: hypothetical protein VHA30_03875, partial [Patescibacteria group bacterium]|nr:hypothetical protein [Patescibacteria group bacterium]
DDAKVVRAGGKVVAAEEVYSLWQADSELKKLLAYAAGRPLTAADVQNLASDNRQTEAFDLTNAIADNRKDQVFVLMQRFLADQTGADEKTAIIQLNALLAEQFRNVALVQALQQEKKTDSQILEATDWKSGRLFVLKKIAARFAPKTVLDLLAKLSALDDELKSSSTPPRVLLDLIVSQLFL